MLVSVDGRRRLYFFTPAGENGDAQSRRWGVDHVAVVTSTDPDEAIIGGAGIFGGLPAVFNSSVQWVANDTGADFGDGEFHTYILGRNAIVEVSRHALALAAQRLLPGDFRRSVLSMMRR